MSSWLEPYLESIRPIRAHKTVESYKTGIKKFEVFLEEWGDKTIETAPDSSLSSFVLYLARGGLAPSSIHLYTCAVGQYAKWAKENGIITVIMAKPKMPRIDDKLPTVLKEKTLAVYVQICKTVTEPYSTALLLLPLTGLRVSELCSLTLEDMDIDPPWVRFIIRHTKGKKDRYVPMLSSGKPVLRRYLKEERPKLSGDHWLFPNFEGNPLSAAGIQERMRKVRGKLGINTLTPHILRHTYLTILNENGITGFDLAEIAGHKNLNTSRLYVHPSASKLSKMVAQVDTPWMKKKGK